jgi:hypothetical protein
MCNCHVTYVIISPTSGVHYNICRSKSTIQKLGFFHGSIVTKDEPILLIIDGKWLEVIVHMTEFEFNSSFQFAFKVNFDCLPHLPVLAFKKTSNNLSHEQNLKGEGLVYYFSNYS